MKSPVQKQEGKKWTTKAFSVSVFQHQNTWKWSRRKPMCTTTDHMLWNETAQARLMQSDLWEQELVPRLPAELEEQAKVLGARPRRGGIKQASQLLRAVLSWIHGPRSLQQLGAWAVLLGLADLSDTAWRKRLAKCGDWLNWLLQGALGGRGEHRVEPKGTGRVVVVDGTKLLPPGGTGKDGWLVQITYDIGAGALVDIRVGDAHLAETLLGLPLGQSDLLLNDRGFTRRAGIAAVARQQAHYLGRWSQTRARLRAVRMGPECRMDEWLESIEAERSIAERPGRCVLDTQVVPVRVLALRLPPGQAKQAQERLQRIAVRKMRQIRERTFKRAG